MQSCKLLTLLNAISHPEQVRGANYLKDKKKIPAQEPMFSLAATDLLQLEKPIFNIARFLPSLRSAIIN